MKFFISGPLTHFDYEAKNGCHLYSIGVNGATFRKFSKTSIKTKFNTGDHVFVSGFIEFYNDFIVNYQVGEIYQCSQYTNINAICLYYVKLKTIEKEKSSGIPITLQQRKDKKGPPPETIYLEFKTIIPSNVTGFKEEEYVNAYGIMQFYKNKSNKIFPSIKLNSMSHINSNQTPIAKEIKGKEPIKKEKVAVPAKKEYEDDEPF